MPASNAIHAFGTLLKRNGTTIGEVYDISGPSLSRDNVEITHHQSPGRWREKMKSLKDAGDVTFSIQYVPTEATHRLSTGILADLNTDTGALDTWSIVFPDTGATTWSFSGFIAGFEPKEPIDDRLTADVTITVSGQPTLV